jgi:hypothetical protein
MELINECQIISLNKIPDARGNLSFVESRKHVPFAIERVYYLYDVPASSSRGGHAHKQLQQLIIAAAGSFTVVLDDGHQKKSFHLNKPYEGLYICPMIWREIHDFSSGSVCLVLASELYDESDYFRDYKNFIQTVKQS